MTRRDEIVTATLTLLATTPLDRVTTRQIAAEVGLSQPALFRHYANRDAIVEAAVGRMRGEMEAQASVALDSPVGSTADARALPRVEAIARALGAYAVRWPGLPRLLFRDVARGEDTAWGVALRELQHAQRGLVGSLVRAAMASGEAPAGVDADRAGALFVAGMQGVLAQWLVGGARGTPDVIGFVQIWRAGILAGVPAVDPDAHPPAGDDGQAGDVQPGDVLVDAVPLLQAGVDPLAAVLAAAETVTPEGRLRVRAPFPPAPLVALLRARGWEVALGQREAGGWELVARR